MLGLKLGASHMKILQENSVDRGRYTEFQQWIQTVGQIVVQMQGVC
jgi:hypothetical protein